MTKVLQLLALCISLVVAPFAALAAVSPENVEGATTVSVDDAYTLFEEGVVFVDVRKMADVDAGTIPGAVHLDVKSAFTEAELGALVDKATAVVVFCNGHACLRSSQAAAMAVEWGFTKVYYMRDGYPAWETAGFPIQ